jgi:hypothetical protein
VIATHKKLMRFPFAQSERQWVFPSPYAPDPKIVNFAANMSLPAAKCILTTPIKLVYSGDGSAIPVTYPLDIWATALQDYVKRLVI